MAPNNSSTWKVSFVLILALPGAAQMPGVKFEIDLDNGVNYQFDATEQSKWASSPGIVPALPSPSAYRPTFGIMDIVAVNGKPAKGLWALRLLGINFRPQPTPGQAVADVNRTFFIDELFEFLQEDGTPVGS